MLDETAEGNLFAALRTREADLEKHLQSGQGAEQKDEAREKAREEARKKLEAELASAQRRAQAAARVRQRRRLPARPGAQPPQGQDGAGQQDGGRAQGRGDDQLSEAASATPNARAPHGRSRFWRCTMTDDDLLRYSRHLLLDDIGIEGQAPAARRARARDRRRRPRLAGGALPRHGRRRPDHARRRRHGRPHQPAAADRPRPVDASASRRRSRRRCASRAHQPADRGHRAARARRRGARLDELVADADVVVDCSDNFATRQAVNAACVRARPAAGRRRGDRLRRPDLGLRHPRCRRRPATPALFPPDAAFEDVACSTMGVFAPLVGIIGSVQAAEALKLLAGIGSSLAGRLQMLDARTMEWTEMRVARDPGCPVCAGRPGRRHARGRRRGLLGFER